MSDSSRNENGRFIVILGADGRHGPTGIQENPANPQQAKAGFGRKGRLMAKQLHVERRTSEHYPWQLVDLTAGFSTVVSIHRTKREADTARYELRKRRRYDARVAKRSAERRKVNG